MEKNCINVNDVIALCHIVDKYDEFYNNVISFYSGKNRGNLLCKLEEVSHNKNCFNAGKVKRFYRDNQSVIDTINKYSHIVPFIFDNYRDDSRSNYISYLDKYILNNKENLDSILVLLGKIKKLGIGELIFNENADFSNELYSVNPVGFWWSFTSISYLDNLAVVLGYDSNIINYKTGGSNYKIILESSLFDIFKPDPDNVTHKKIILNDLTFDASRLPDTISCQGIVNKIIELQSKLKKDYSVIQGSVNLSIGMEDLSLLIDRLDGIVEGLNDSYDKEKLIGLLSNIRQIAEEMKYISCDYDKHAIDDNELITSTLLADEKRLYKQRIARAKYDV